MAVYVLVPGGWHGGWWFRPLVERLHAAGHDAYALTPTGLGDRSHLVDTAVNLDTHIQDLVNVIDYEHLDDVVLCAHSYGGMVVAGALEQIFDRVAAIVLLDAQVPRDGESLWDITDDASRRLFVDNTVDGRAVAPPPGLDPRTTAHPLACFLQPVTLPHGGFDRVARKVFVYMAGWPDSPLEAMHARVTDDPGWVTEIWPTGHDIIGEALDETTALLLRLEPHR